ncbi:MAG: RecX family transcriptional regulator [Eubacterium sp.]|nr:RecX family transcriptional regulator [Eubacterium sp.]
MIVTEITALAHSKGKVKVCFEQAESLILYLSEVRNYGLEEQTAVSDELYETLYHEVVGKRAVKRAMHLLEKMDRTEAQLVRKLSESGYPDELVKEAVAYVKSYHYIDDERYARTFVRLNQERKSIGRMRMDLLARGVAEDIVARALEEETETEPEALIQKILEKKQFNPQTATHRETAKMYQFLLRKGFRSSEIMHLLKDMDSYGQNF